MTNEWTDHGVILPANYIEDLRVVREGDGFAAYFVAGPRFGNTTLHRAHAASPLGPFSDASSTGHTHHTRLYSGRIDALRRIITAVWPGLPRAGLWLFSEEPYGMVKEIFIGPKPDTGYSIAAANPAVIQLPNGTYEIYFEGRAELVHWSVFRATWKGGTDAPIVDDTPFLPGCANPSLVIHDDRLYLYYSKHAGHLFETCAMSRPL